MFDLQGSGSRSSPCGTITDCCIMASICSRHSRNTTKMKSGLWFRCIFGSVSSINVILTHTKKGQSKQVHFRELKPHLIGQTPGLEMYSFFLERSRTLHTMLQPAKASGAKKTQTKWFISGRWLVRFPSLVGTQIFGAHEHRIRQTCITRPFFHLTCLVW